MVAVPLLVPVMSPDASTDTIPDAVLLHVPPPVLAVRVAVAPVQSELTPLMVPATGAGSTVIVAADVAVLIQPATDLILVIVYVELTDGLTISDAVPLPFRTMVWLAPPFTL